MAYTAKVLAPQQVERFEKTGKKSGMMIVSSGAGKFPTAGFSVYSATKAFDHFVATGLGVEF